MSPHFFCQCFPYLGEKTPGTTTLGNASFLKRFTPNSLANLGIEGADFLACEAFESGITLSLFLSLHGMDIHIS